jgi:multidrug efflux pump
MGRFIDYAISHARLTIATLIFLLAAGMVAYVTIPKEAEPDVRIPIIYVQLSQRGISPEDAERLLLRPVETQLKSVGNVKEMRSTAFEGGGFVLLEFEAGFDSKSALADVRAKVDQSKHDLPKDVDEPQVLEVNLSLYPVLVVALSGDVPERTLLRVARSAKNAIEQLPGVLAAELRGSRDEAVEIIIDPTLMKSYGLSLDQLGQITQSFNTLIAAGALEGETGRFAVKVPSLFEKPQDILKVPVIASPNASVTLGDIAQIRPTFKDATSVTRVNGQPAMTIEVSKRTGANLIETVDGVKATIDALRKTWPGAVSVTFTQDKSKVIRQMLGDLQNSVATGVLLVAVVILFALGFRASLFIGIAIPVSFLTGVLGLQLAGLTVNIVVLFSLILAVGMLVDDAIIVSEYAERRMAEGMGSKEAYSLAAKRMAGPVIAATATRIAAFSPLLFWPGVVGQFMKYLPITLIATLSASLAVALFFTPTLGALLGRAAPADERGSRRVSPARSRASFDALCARLFKWTRWPFAAHAGAAVGPHDERAKDRGPYMRTVRLALRHPGTTLALAAFLLVAVQVTYGKFGRGVEFFPNVEPDFGQVIVHGRGNLSLDEKAKIVGDIEQRVLTFDGLKTVYTRVGEQPRGLSELSEDTIGVIQFEFADWQTRAPAHTIMEAIRTKTADMPGVLIEVTAPRAGPPTGKPIQVQIGALNPEVLPAAAKKVAAILAQRPDIRDLDDGLPLPGIDWTIQVNKAEAAKYGAGVGTVGSAVQLVTNGLKATEYRPVDSDKSVDILVRFPSDRRSLDQIDDLRVQTPSGHVPIGNFVERVPSPRVGHINRVASNRVMTVSANVAEGAQTANVQAAITEELRKADLGPGVLWRLKGEDEERAKASAFLLQAFGTAIFLIFAILLAQFNKLASVMLVLTAVVLSTIGVLLGLLIMGQPFGVVMTGIGVIANAGVIVNNNIVLIDTYDRLRREGKEAYDAILETCRERARPVVLTAMTAILGVLPIAFGMNIEFLSREITIGAPATQWWINLSTAIVFGLGFATVLTLVVTPAALMAMANFSERRGQRLERLRAWLASLRARLPAFGRRPSSSRPA